MIKSPTAPLLALLALLGNGQCKTADEAGCEACIPPTACNALGECQCPSENQTFDAESALCLHESGYYMAFLSEDALLGTDTFALHADLTPEENPDAFEALFREPFDVGAQRSTSTSLHFKDATSRQTMRNVYASGANARLARTGSGYAFDCSSFRLPYRPGFGGQNLAGRPVRVHLSVSFDRPGQDTLAAQLRWLALDDTLATDVVQPLDFVLVKKVVRLR